MLNFRQFIKIKKPQLFIISLIILVLIGAFLVSFFVLSQSSNQKTIHATHLTNGLIGHWTLDEVDSSNNGNQLIDKSVYNRHGTNIGGATFITDRLGKEGGAMYFNGSNYISMGIGSDFFPLDRFTICSWLKTPGIASGNNTNGIFSMTHGLTMYLNQSGYFYSRVDDGNSTPIEGVLINLHDDKFHQVCLSFDGESRHMFVDGVLEKSKATTWLGYTRWLRDLISIGVESNDKSVRKFNGTLDDVRLYNRALSEEEIKTLYDSYDPKTVIGSLQQGLVLDMPLKSNYTKTEISGSQIITDRSPYSYDGQNYGAIITNEGSVFSGSTDNIRINRTLSYTNEMTFSLWINPSEDLVPGMGMSVLLAPSPHGSFQLYRNSNSNQATNRLYWLMYHPNGHVIPSYIYPVNEWTQTTFSFFSDGSYKVYINGNLQTTGNASNFSNWALPNSYLRLGYGFPGMIANVLIYNRALSDEEVKMLYDRGRSDAGIIFSN